MTTDELIASVRALLAKRTAGEWRARAVVDEITGCPSDAISAYDANAAEYGPFGVALFDCATPADAALVAAAPASLQSLCDALEAEMERAARLSAALDSVAELVRAACAEAVAASCGYTYDAKNARKTRMALETKITELRR